MSGAEDLFSDVTKPIKLQAGLFGSTFHVAVDIRSKRSVEKLSYLLSKLISLHSAGAIRSHSNQASWSNPSLSKRTASRTWDTLYGPRPIASVPSKGFEYDRLDLRVEALSLVDSSDLPLAQIWMLVASEAQVRCFVEAQSPKDSVDWSSSWLLFKP
jgi:hypothetical protein